MQLPRQGCAHPVARIQTQKWGEWRETPAFPVWTQQRFSFLFEKVKKKEKKKSPGLGLFQAERLPSAGPMPRSCCEMEIGQHKAVSRGSFQQVKCE